MCVRLCRDALPRVPLDERSPASGEAPFAFASIVSENAAAAAMEEVRSADGFLNSSESQRGQTRARVEQLVQSMERGARAYLEAHRIFCSWW